MDQLSQTARLVYLATIEQLTQLLEFANAMLNFMMTQLLFVNHVTLPAKLVQEDRYL